MTSSYNRWKKVVEDSAKQTLRHSGQGVTKADRAFLRTDNPELLDLRRRYATTTQMFGPPTIWHDQHVQPADLLFFRGDNAYVWQYQDGNRPETYLLTYFYMKEIAHAAIDAGADIVSDIIIQSAAAMAIRALGLRLLAPLSTPAEYIAAVDDRRRPDIAALDQLIRTHAPELEPVIMGGMLGYGPFHYRYASGREGDACKLSIASIDVGGGTTDLIINSYGLEGAGASVTLFPEQKFREGFNVAGDDILLRVVQGHVLPPIEAAMRAAGIANPTDLMA